MRDIDYDAWARTYDDTRGASPSVLAPVLETLGSPAGRSLLDIGGGTGNVALAMARAGFRVTLCDFAPAMASRAAAKLPPDAPVVAADAQRLPFRGSAFDCAVSVKVMNHVPDWRAMLREARRVTREGPVVLVQATRETLDGNWICEYVPSLREQDRYQTETETVAALLAAGFRTVGLRYVRYRDLADGSAQALKRFPEVLAQGDHLRNTSLLHSLSSAAVDHVLAAIRRDFKSGRLKEIIARYEPVSERHGDGTIFIANP